ncbi:MAG: phospholipid carrier-dependent glycosyltransferase [Chloroflexi bacterium]|nr:phospholipid carrier-dependent glycosyltransferase [Chloroflexota bacterium]
MTGPAVGGPDPGRGAPSRTGAASRTEAADATWGILILLAVGLALRLIIAYLLPDSGFRVDISSFQFWANELADNGIPGFYARAADPVTGFFADYTPGYLYVLWAVGTVANVLGMAGPGELIKIPPILADLVLGYLVWSMARELGAGERAARVGALLVVLNPVTWVDSTIWGQVDSVGLIPLLLAVRELWRDRPERAAVLAMVAALIKPQLGILIPIVAVVTIRRALMPRGAYGEDDPDPSTYSRTALEARIRGPIRILTTGAAGLLTALALSLPFGLGLPGLIGQIFSTAAGYPYLSVNAYNPWALVGQARPDGGVDGIAVNRQWVCDSTTVPREAFDIRIGDWLLYHVPAPPPDARCIGDPGVTFGALPAVAVGALLLLAAVAIVAAVVWRRPDRRTILVGLVVLSVAFFVLPTRVHERYLFPFVGIAAILAGASLRWRVAYVLGSAAVFANMYAVLTTLYTDNPGISDWLGIGPLLTSYWGVAAAAAAVTAVFAWAVLQLRAEADEQLADELTASADEPGDEELEFEPLPEPAAPTVGWGAPTATAFEPVRPGPPAGPPVPSTGLPPAAGALAPAWDEPGLAGEGPWAWFVARFRARPVRADRTAGLSNERGGRFDKLDVWILVVLAIAMLSIRLWRLPEPYQMHFDEVYHPRTATEFLQDWRYGIDHNIYEWTHPHLAKYAMALGIMAFADDRVVATSRLGQAVVDATIEPRRDDTLAGAPLEGDRLWVATGSQVLGYDLRTRELTATADLPGVVAVAIERPLARLYAATRSGEILEADLGPLDATRGQGVSPLDLRDLLDLGAPIEALFITTDGSRLAAVLAPSAEDAAVQEVVTIDTGAGTVVGRTELTGVTQLADGGQGRIAIATAEGLAFIDPETGEVGDLVDVEGPATGAVKTSGISDDPILVPYSAADGPRVAVVIAKPDETPRVSTSFVLPGTRAGRAFFDTASRMVHVEGSRPDQPGTTTVYVIEPHGNPPTVYADAALPFEPVAIVLDDNERYPSSDRQQLLALDAGGEVAAVPIGRHAFAWRLPGVVAGVLMALSLYLLARILFRRRSIAVIAGLLALADGMLFAQSRIGMNDAYVGLGIVAAYMVFAALWLRPPRGARGWLAFVFGMLAVGLLLGLALASKWVAAYAIGALGVLVLSRSALGRLLAILGLIVASTALGYLAISVPEGETGGNYLFLAIMVALTLAGVVANVAHPIAWTLEEQRLATFAAPVAGGLALLVGAARGDPLAPLDLGPLAVTPLELAIAGLVFGAAVHTGFVITGRLGFGPLAQAAGPGEPGAALDPPAPAPTGWLRLGSGFGLPAAWLAICLVVVPVAVYVVSYIPWAFIENHQLIEGWPAGHTGQTLIDLTADMYNYHNRLSSAHPASSPWWAWPFDLKPVWFYQESFAGGSAGAIYDAGNLVAWWLAVPALAFVAWQAFARRSPALALIAIAFAFQWLSWARIARAAFQYHYYTSLPFVFLALAYFLAELWHGPSRRTWLLARVSAGLAVLGPFTLWLLHRPLCAVVRVTDVNPGSQACPTVIPEIPVAPGALALAIVLGIGVLLLLRELLALADEADAASLEGGAWGSAGFRDRLRTTILVGAGVVVAVGFVTAFLRGGETINIPNVPVEPIALVVLLALSPVAAYVATARDSRRFVIGALLAIGVWFVLWYPNISGLPMPSNLHNAYQGFLPTYLYPFQFPVSTLDRSVDAPSLFDVGPAIMLLAIAFTALVVGYSTWSWRVALAERRLERAAATGAPGVPAAPE